MSGAERLSQWFAAQCDGDWEHMNGVHIETTDNPGWYVKIDLSTHEITGKGERDGMTWHVHAWQLLGYDEGAGNLEGLLNLMADVLEGKV